MNSDKTSREYATKDISNIVGIAPPTVRKYSQALEKAGYSFLKNENGFRIYSDKDIFAFNEIKNVSKKNGMPVEKIAEMIVFNKRQEIQHESLVDTVKIIQSDSGNSSDIEQYDDRYNELMSKLSKLDMLDDISMELQEVKGTNKSLLEQMKQQQDFNQKLLQEYKKQSDQLDKLVTIVSQDRELFNQSRDLLDSIVNDKQQAEQEVATAEQKSKGFFSRWFGK